MSQIELPMFYFEGTHEEIGHAHGESLRQMIQGFTESRYEAAARYFSNENAKDKTPQGLTDLARQCLLIYKEWDLIGYEEHVAIAQGAQIDPARLFVATGYTDMRDAYLLAGDKPDSEGCTALMLPGSMTADGCLVGAQSWDLDPADLEYVVAIHSKPNNAPERWSVSTSGCLSLMGLNSHGIGVGTTNIKTYGAKAGVSYINIIHRALRMGSVEEAGKMVASAPRSGAHTYWLVDKELGYEYETTPQSYESYKLGKDKSRVWSNHCLSPKHIKTEYQEPSSSSLKRLSRMESLMSKGPISVEDIKKAFANRQDGVDSISRLVEDGEGTTTNACVITIPEKRMILACKGPADQGKWVLLPFTDQ